MLSGIQGDLCPQAQSVARCENVQFSGRKKKQQQKKPAPLHLKLLSCLVWLPRSLLNVTIFNLSDNTQHTHTHDVQSQIRGERMTLSISCSFTHACRAALTRSWQGRPRVSLEASERRAGPSLRRRLSNGTNMIVALTCFRGRRRGSDWRAARPGARHFWLGRRGGEKSERLDGV